MTYLAKPKEQKRRRRRSHIMRDRTRERRALEKQADAIVRETVYIRDGYRCVKCGTGKALTPSHIRPRGKCPRMTWMSKNILTMCAACHREWWHKDPIAGIDWLRVKYPGLYEELLMWERIAPKVDMKELLISLQLELDEEPLNTQIGGRPNRWTKLPSKCAAKVSSRKSQSGLPAESGK